MEEASSVGDIIKVSINLNQQAEQDEAQIILGPEWDSALITRLHRVIESLGGSIRESSWRVSGSQEVCTYAIRLAGGRLTANSETYMGLSLRGPAHLVQRIASAMKSDSKGNANTQK